MQTSETMIDLASIRLMLNRIAQRETFQTPSETSRCPAKFPRHLSDRRDRNPFVKKVGVGMLRHHVRGWLFPPNFWSPSRPAFSSGPTKSIIIRLVFGLFF